MNGNLVPEYKPSWAKKIRAAIKTVVKESGKKGVVIGLSGGIDSAVVTKLCYDALGKYRVLCLILPTDRNDDTNTKETVELALEMGFLNLTYDLSRMLAAALLDLDAYKSKLRTGNLKARLRMMTLYDFATSENYLVMGTSNRSELMTGYFTKYGDGGVDFEPIGDLYKTQVRALARQIGIPDRIIKKKPTAGLWKGQTDEGQLHMTYDNLDQILVGFDKKMADGLISKKIGLPKKEVARIRAMVRSSEHKRRMPKCVKLRR